MRNQPQTPFKIQTTLPGFLRGIQLEAELPGTRRLESRRPGSYCTATESPMRHVRLLCITPYKRDDEPFPLFENISASQGARVNCR